MQQKTCLIIAGPTAVGKTSMAVKLAQHFGTAIISADSRQCFKELNTGVAKPSQEELNLVPHYFINSHTIAEDVNAAVFEANALQAVAEIFRQHDIAVMTGGTGLYIKAFCEGMDSMPSVSPAIREAITTQYEQYGIEWLQQQVQLQDPEYFSAGEIQNPRRLMRALEIMQSTGKSIRSFQQGKKAARDFRIVKAGLSLPKEELHRNINFRVDMMMQQGLEEEVRQLWPHRHLNALQTVGYTELFDYMTGNSTLEQAIEKIKRNTRQYAKRQLTWFRRDPDFKWFSPADMQSIIDYSQL